MLRKLYYMLSDYAKRPAWWPVIRIFGGPYGAYSRVCYLTRVVLSPKIRGGQYYLHIFHREDMDRDPHDHPFDFTTVPINQGYTEEVFDPVAKCFREVHVDRWRRSRRTAEHTHRIVACDAGWPLVTIVWRGPTRRRWGFWCHTDEQVANNPGDTTRVKVPWQSYVFHGNHANVVGADEYCPGATE